MMRLAGDQHLRAGHDRRVLVIVLITKFLAGAWITILAMVVFFRS